MLFCYGNPIKLMHYFWISIPLLTAAVQTCNLFQCPCTPRSTTWWKEIEKHLDICGPALVYYRAESPTSWHEMVQDHGVSQRLNVSWSKLRLELDQKSYPGCTLHYVPLLLHSLLRHTLIKHAHRFSPDVLLPRSPTWDVASKDMCTPMSWHKARFIFYIPLITSPADPPYWLQTFHSSCSDTYSCSQCGLSCISKGPVSALLLGT